MGQSQVDLALLLYFSKVFIIFYSVIEGTVFHHFFTDQKLPVFYRADYYIDSVSAIDSQNDTRK